MASTLPQEIGSRRAVSANLGKQLLDVITSGMYSDPRMAIREYIQNAADSIDLAYAQGVYTSERSCIQVTLDGHERVIIIEDNGVGIDGGDVDSQLGNLGCSTKIGSGQRGFRGIGRLGGLAYCDLLRFETRRTAQKPVYVVEWNGQALREQVTQATSHEQLADAVRRIAFVGERRAERVADPSRFFRACMVNVHRFHSDLLMSVKGLREYLSQTAPVGYECDGFPFAKQIEQHLEAVPGYQSYNVMLNGAAVVRPYKEDIETREGLIDHIRDIELVECVSRQGQLLCRGWFAQTGFLSAFPQYVTMRGIRLRQGNIAVGDEYFFKDLFTESRFATWHIGELHVTPELKLNARRDGFEESPEYEEFLEWVSFLCRRLSRLCRDSSKDRSARQSADRIVNELGRLIDVPFFVDEEHAVAFSQTTGKQLERLQQTMAISDSDMRKTLSDIEARVTKMREQPVFLQDILDGRTLRGKDNRQLLVAICKSMLTANHGGNGAGLIREVVAPYLRPHSEF
ncbi:MAG: ATP-binding protein [Rectinemataceae bacterium]|jgi:molecular chaperone HtpG